MTPKHFKIHDKRLVNMLLFACLVASMSGLGGCAYLKTSAKQVGYNLRQDINPSQRIERYLLNSPTIFVSGRIKAGGSNGADPVAVVALSRDRGRNVVVTADYAVQPGDSYSLNLPPGEYRLVLARRATLPAKGLELLGLRELRLLPDSGTQGVLGGVDVVMNGFSFDPATLKFKVKIPRPRPQVASTQQLAANYRELSDPIFNLSMAMLGTYEPAAFLDRVSEFFFALEPNQAGRIPVVFVHGISGSPREFAAMAASLDHSRYYPCYFYYPSGYSLTRLAQVFHDQFLSSSINEWEDRPMVIIAHSMGGLVVREAMNLMQEQGGSTRVAQIITIASPLGGMISAGTGVNAPVVIPVWRDLDPAGRFISKLYRTPLGPELDYRLLYANGDDRLIRIGGESDGVVPLLSQLREEAVAEASAVTGFMESHAGVLEDEAAIAAVRDMVAQVH